MMTMISTEVMNYDKERHQLTMPSEYTAGVFPVELAVVSHHTGRTIVFDQDVDAAVLHEYWDGEQMVYKSKYESTGINLVIYHAY